MPNHLSRTRYSRFANNYVTSQTHAEGDDLNRLVEIAQPKKGWVVLDIATGGGHTALKFAPHVAKVIATDITLAMVATAQTFAAKSKTKNILFQAADAENLPFPDQSFDLVTCRIAAHHFPDCSRFVKENTRVLKDRGLLLVQDHVLPEDRSVADYIESFEKTRDPSHHKAYTNMEWRNMFEAEGLEIAHTEQILKRHAFTSWVQRQECTPQTINRLIAMAKDAPEKVLTWMRPDRFGTPEATFVNHHIIIAGRCGRAEKYRFSNRNVS